MYPQNLKYTTTHEWARVEGNQATIGITDHAQSELGDVVFVELPEVGAEVRKGSAFGSVESVKTVSDLIAAVSGKIVKVNEELLNKPELVNEEPYEAGWLAVVEMSNPDESNDLLDADGYEALIGEE